MGPTECGGHIARQRPQPTGRGSVWRSGLVAAAASLAFACVAGAPPDDLASPAELTRPSEASWQRLALHALLVPLLDSDGELAWAQPNDMLPCRDGASVRVDGRPVPYGARFPRDRPVVVSFQLNDCWPLGTSWIGLWGTLDMAVVHEGSRLRVTVLPGDLRAAVNGAHVPLRADFVGAVSLAAAAYRP